jgi:hypothetical protein
MIMKGKNGKKTLKTVLAATGVAAMVLLPTGCATAATGGSGGVVGTGSGGLLGGIL